jgi:hypothetical protein
MLKTKVAAKKIAHNKKTPDFSIAFYTMLQQFFTVYSCFLSTKLTIESRLVNFKKMFKKPTAFFLTKLRKRVPLQDTAENSRFVNKFWNVFFRLFSNWYIRYMTMSLNHRNSNLLSTLVCVNLVPVTNFFPAQF